MAELEELSKKLLETESALSAFWHLAPNLFIISERDGKIYKVNAAWTRIMGYELSELVGHYSYEFVHPYDLEATRQVRAKAFREMKLENFQHRWIKKDGTYQTLLWNSTLLYHDRFIYAIAQVIP